MRRTAPTAARAARFAPPDGLTWPRRVLAALMACSATAVRGAATCAAVALMASPGLAQSPAVNAGFDVRIIEGSRGAAPKVDARLGDLSRELSALQQGYNVFSLVSEQSLRLQLAQRGAVKLPDGADLGIQLLEITAGPPMRIRHSFELPKSKSIRSVAPGGRTLDVRAGAEKLVIICTTVHR